MSLAPQFPWDDMKVAYAIDDDAPLWAAWDKGTFEKRLPPGWSLDETDGAGGRLVAVFRVERMLTITDGRAVENLLRKIGAVAPVLAAAE